MDSMRNSGKHPQADTLGADLRLRRECGLLEATLQIARCRKDGRDDLIVGMEHYLDPDGFNKRFCHATGEEAKDLLKTILKDSAQAHRLVQGQLWRDRRLLALAQGCIDKQTMEEGGALRLRVKEDGGFHSGMLQNPSDPDAAFRKKAGREHRGYAANVEEAVGENGSRLTDYQYEQNTYSDSQFLKDSIDSAPKQEEDTILIADGAYGGYRAA